ncbi:MAG: hypothetical protein HFI93_05775 [Lachnospiraceae bacterium]|nr:hypothetical protein [Lachnospiraceae bacterium]
MKKKGKKWLTAGILLTVTVIVLFGCQKSAEVSFLDEEETNVSTETERTEDVPDNRPRMLQEVREAMARAALAGVSVHMQAAGEPETLPESGTAGAETLETPAESSSAPVSSEAGSAAEKPEPTEGKESPSEAVSPPPSQPETAAPTSAPEPEQSFAAQLKASAGVSQMILVEASGTAATVTMHQKNGAGLWEEIYRTSGYVGRDGVGNTTEYNAMAPAGVYTLGPIFGTEPDPGCPRGYIRVEEGHYWVDDVDSVYYNQMISTKTEGIDPSAFNSAERLWIETTAYAYAAAINYNTACVPGQGSAIFLHVSEGVPTEGCISVPREAMVFFLTHLSSDTRIVIGNASGAFALSQY